jgi:CspA family cold shock protein
LTACAAFSDARTREVVVPTGRVRFFNAEKGFGFISTGDQDDIFVHVSALPEGTTELQQGTRVDFSVAEGRKGRQALSVRILEAPPSVAKAKRRKPEDLAVDVQSLANVLDNVAVELGKGRYPDPKKLQPVLDYLNKVVAELKG